MRRFSRVMLWSGLVVCLTVGSAPAQLINEIVRGAVNDVSSDIFNCRRGNNPCDLGYRVYSEVDPSEINGPANPVDGIPRYVDNQKQYRSDANTTANYPVSGGSGDGNEWYVVWDGQTGGGTSDHAGWYGAQSQIVNYGERGNSLSFNCLPVTGQEACFRALSPLNGSNDTTRADGSTLSHDGGISPIPIPQIAQNGLSTIKLDWEFTANSTETDGAGSAIDTQTIWAVGNPLSFPTDGDLSASAVAVATVPRSQTSVELDRATLSATAGLDCSTTYGFATTLDYQGGLGSNFSGNSAQTGVQAANEPGDAPFPVDVEEMYLEVRSDDSGNRFLVVTFYMADPTVAKNQIRYKIEFNGTQSKQVELIAFPSSASRNKAGVGVLLHANASFDAGDLVGNSSLDNGCGRVSVVLNLDNLEAAVGGVAGMTAQVRLPSSRDDVDLGTVDFSSLE